MFSPAADFLLDMQFVNLFEPASATPTNLDFRCKGCGEIVPMSQREKHYNKHKRERDRRVAIQREKSREAKAKILAHARRIKAERSA